MPTMVRCASRTALWWCVLRQGSVQGRPFGRTPEKVKGADGKSYPTFSWEQTDRAEALRKDAKL
jgi:hypothetical protein